MWSRSRMRSESAAGLRRAFAASWRTKRPSEQPSQPSASRSGDPEVLLYNAGYTSHGASEVLAQDLPVGLVDAAMAVQARGALLCAKEVIGAMRRNRKGVILMSGVPNAVLPAQKNMTNAMSKAAQRALAFALSAEYRQYGVAVSHVVISGIVDSPGTRPLARRPRAAPMMLSAADVADEYWKLHLRGEDAPREVFLARRRGLRQMLVQMAERAEEVVLPAPRL
eukprot:TRINITY_DN11394_c0_g1_i1.p1 TRINITY_DN11394_c0_g1~~TRINITY_DN11394_c0_g1_i1.p1  ORF type:complete len:224 (+),score=55.01 TRINITY_DN11394_c0_g1_i1:253-924(+)